MIHSLRLFLLLVFIGGLVISGCGQSGKDPAAQVVESYIQATVGKDANTVAGLSCKDWEQQAVMDVDSYQTYGVTLDGLSCQVKGKEGNLTLVGCQGKIVISYNTEKQEQDLSLRTYTVSQEGSEWRVCGYR